MMVYATRIRIDGITAETSSEFKCPHADGRPLAYVTVRCMHVMYAVPFTPVPRPKDLCPLTGIDLGVGVKTEWKASQKIELALNVKVSDSKRYPVADAFISALEKASESGLPLESEL
jgi:hypothetical protein